MASDMWFDDLFPEREPVFVLGAARSGTSIVADMLRLGAGLPGSWEGHLFHVAYLLLGEVERLWGTVGPPFEHFARDRRPDRDPERAVALFDVDELKRDVLRHFDGLCLQAYGPRWLDKTPERHMLHACPMLMGAYPAARFLFVHRNGIRVVESRQITHPEMSFAEACADWAGITRDWLTHRRRLGSRFLPLAYEEVVAEPEATCRAIAGHVGLSEDDVPAMLDVMATRNISPTSDDPSAPRRLSDTAWSADQRKVFRSICGEAMTGLGYRM